MAGLDNMCEDHTVSCFPQKYTEHPTLRNKDNERVFKTTWAKMNPVCVHACVCVCVCGCVYSLGWGFSAGRRCPCGRPGVDMTGGTGRTFSQPAGRLWCLFSHQCLSDCGWPPRCNLTQFRVCYCFRRHLGICYCLYLRTAAMVTCRLIYTDLWLRRYQL